MIEIINTEKGVVTDQEVAEAVSTIRRYCENNDLDTCDSNCVIRQICRVYFHGPTVPALWPEVEAPDD